MADTEDQSGVRDEDGRRSPIAGYNNNKTSYGAKPISPSPPHSSPTLTQSTSNSNSSGSPPQPTTPPRHSRSRTRYPDLGRVPLHRRGTSKTYERLEDLLREAGYKETRVFTPENERGDGERKEKKDAKSGTKGGMGAVVGFLAGLMQSSTSTKSLRTQDVAGDDEMVAPSPASPPLIPDSYSPPTSPLARRQSRRDQGGEGSLTPTLMTMTNSIEALQPTSQTHTPLYSSQSLAESYHPQSTNSRQQTQPQSNRPGLVHRHTVQSQYMPPLLAPMDGHPSLQRRYSQASTQRQNQPLIQSPTPVRHNNFSQFRSISPPLLAPRARAHLRHMSSVPSIPQRPNSTSAQKRALSRRTILLNDSDSESPEAVDRKRGNGDGEVDAMLPTNQGPGGMVQPPLPKNWLESVAKAVLSGGAGTHSGAPIQWSSSHNHRPADLSLSRQSSRNSYYTTRSQYQSPSSRTPFSYHANQKDHAHSISHGSPYRDMRGPRRSATPVAVSEGRLTTLSDRTHPAAMFRHSQFLPPPELLAKIGKGRSERSQGEVIMMQVVCKSAPASRAGSRVRGGRHQVEESGFSAVVDRVRGRRRTREHEPLVPTLAKTKAQGDAWARAQRASDMEVLKDHEKGRCKSDSEHPESESGNRYLSGWGADGLPSGSKILRSTHHGGDLGDQGDEEDGEEDEDDSDDGEPNLAKILVPPKRQNSIRSLRRHLHSSLAVPMIPAPDILQEEDSENDMPTSGAVTSRANANLIHTDSILSQKNPQGSAHVPRLVDRSSGRQPQQDIKGSRLRRAYHDSPDQIYDQIETDEEAYAQLMKATGGRVRTGSGRSNTSGNGSGRSTNGRNSRLGLPSNWGTAASGAVVP